jgi:hypothetical protein
VWLLYGGVGALPSRNSSNRKKLWIMPSGVRELIALSLLAGFGWGLAWARDDLIFVGVFAGATVMTVVEAIRRSR